MARKKKIRTRGKIQLSRYFQKLSPGDFVAIAREEAVQPRFPKRFQGLTGVVEGERGRSCIVKIKDGNEEKRILIEPINLKKIKHKEKINKIKTKK